MKPIDNLSDDEWSQLVQRAAALADAPPSLVRTALDLWPTQRPMSSERPAALLRRVSAVLRFDSWATTPLAAGMRSWPSDVRHLLFSALGRDIDLRIAPVGGRFALAGQILGPDGSGRIELAREADPRAGAQASPATLVAELDELGEFRLDCVSSGTYRLTLCIGSDEIVLAPVEVGAQSDRSGP